MGFLTRSLYLLWVSLVRLSLLGVAVAVAVVNDGLNIFEPESVSTSFSNNSFWVSLSFKVGLSSPAVVSVVAASSFSVGFEYEAYFVKMKYMKVVFI